MKAKTKPAKQRLDVCTSCNPRSGAALGLEVLCLECTLDPLKRRDYSEPRTSELGHVEYITNGVPHRYTGPAVVYSDGHEVWMLGGAYVVSRATDGTQRWYRTHHLLGHSESTRELVAEYASETSNFQLIWLMEAFDAYYAALEEGS